MKLIFKAILVTSLLVTAPVNGAIIKAVPISPDQNKEHYISLKGEIDDGDNDKLVRLIGMLKEKQMPVKVLYLNSEGGNIEETFSLLKTVFSNNLETRVKNGEDCISACFFVASVGQPRTLELKSKVGVHRTSLYGKENKQTKMVSTLLLDLLKGANVPDDIILKMIKTPADEIYYLSEEEKIEFNKGIER